MADQHDSVLRWGIKASFRDYLADVGDCTVECTGGAGTSPSGEYEWPVRTIAETYVRCDGLIHITGYDGLLDVELGAPQVTLDLNCDSVELSFATAFGDLALAKGHLINSTAGAGARPWSSLRARVTVTMPGSQVLGGVYLAGSEMDEFTVVSADAV